MASNWFEIKNIDEIDSPALVVFPERVRHNIQLAIHMAGNADRLRPHVKTHKCPDVVQLMMQAGINKFKCATIAEAEMLAQCNAADVLLAYQPSGPKLERFTRLIKKYPATKFSCLVDNPASAAEQSSRFFKHGLTVPVFIDLNTGMNRTGIDPSGATELYHSCQSLTGISISGLHAYDGHIRDTSYPVKKEKCDAAFAAVWQLSHDLQLPRIIAGGSPAFSVHCQRKEVECSPGTFIYWDKGYLESCPEQSFLPAAVLVTRVVSLPAPGIVCTDLGHKSVASENEISRRVFFLNAPDLRPASHSEEHFVWEAGSSHNYKAGDILYGLPYHICPTVALYDSVYAAENNTVTGEWKNIARDRKITV